MHIEYAGSKPSISHTGVMFEDYHPDKFIYFQEVYHLFRLLEEAPAKRNPFVYTPLKKHVNIQEIVSWIEQTHIEIEQTTEEELAKYEQKLQKELTDAQEYCHISPEERDACVSNLEIMYKSRLQRATNKIFYWHMIESISDLILEKDITEFVFPFEMNLFHIAQAFSNHITARKEPINAHITVKESDEGKTYIYLILDKPKPLFT